MSRLHFAVRDGTKHTPRCAFRGVEHFVKAKEQRGGSYLLANNVDRDEADRLRAEHPGAIVSRNADGTYRITRSR